MAMTVRGDGLTMRERGEPFVWEYGLIAVWES
jgi:hypothetical protein